MKFLKIKARNKTLKVKDCRGLRSITGLMFDPMRNHDGALIYGNCLWMPFVKQNLKLVFLDAEFKVVNIQSSVPLSTDSRSWKIYSSPNANYCLETKRNVTVKLGDKLMVK
ncbi:MAG: DUF192 domain-containing protein [Candidatus Aenigmarchaeota archaeon]|nr:DUF192 domain-containing protein [Candidatus Aenigmarchaeota archaeon]